MILEEKKIILKDGTNAVLKTPEIKDAPMQLDCIKMSSGETNFLVHYKEYWEKATLESEEQWIQNNRDADNELVISCYIDGRIVGTCDITFFKGSKTFHRAGIGIAIRKQYWNIGIGTAMFTELLKAAEENPKTEIVELEFVESNERGKALYEKFGFEIVSTIPRAYKLKDGTYQNKVYMQKYL